MDKLEKWSRQKFGRLTIVLLGLGLTYSFISLAIDRGDFQYYLIALICLIIALKYLFALIGEIFHAIIDKK